MTFERGDIDSNLPITTLSNVSTSPEATSLDSLREVPHSDLSAEVRQLSSNRSTDEPERVFHTNHPSLGFEGIVGSPLPNTTLPTMSPLLEGTFSPPSVEIPSTKYGDGRQMLSNSSSDESNTIFFPSTSVAQRKMSVSETPTEHMSVHQSPPTPKPSERVTVDTPAEQFSETPITPTQIDLSLYVTKAEFDLQMSKKNQEIDSLKKRLRLVEEKIDQTPELQTDIL